VDREVVARVEPAQSLEPACGGFARVAFAAERMIAGEAVVNPIGELLDNL
jgi:hypothetical protein